MTRARCHLVCGCVALAWVLACGSGDSSYPDGGGGGTTGAGGPISCDTRAVLCKRAAPNCTGGQVPSVEMQCYGPCVPIESCACAAAADCPNPDMYTCHLSAMHCGPFVR